MRKWGRAGSSFSSCLTELGMSLRTQYTSSHLFFLTLLQQWASVAPSLLLCQYGDSATLCLCFLCLYRKILSVSLFSTPLLLFSCGSHCRVDRTFGLLSGCLPISAQPFGLVPPIGLKFKLCERGFV